MCGIVGAVNVPLNSIEVEAMIQSVGHRGPDAQGIFSIENNKVFFGHTRLSIIDLNENANQPFLSSDGRLVVIFNGEIYNYISLRKSLIEEGHSFRTKSDTEVLVVAFSKWREKIIDYIDGMFAIVVYDKETEELFLFRDRMGKKPLYYFQHEDSLIFSSEMKAILNVKMTRSNIKVRKSSIHTFLHLGYIPEPNTIYDKIFKFPAGNWGVFKDGLLKITQYFSIDDKIERPSMVNAREAISALHKVFIEAVTKRLVSDVPLGVFLSGGTDSSLVAAVANQFTEKTLKTFCVGFNESAFDESQYSHKVAKHLKTEHYEFFLQERDAIEQLDAYLTHFDEPFADTSSIPTMLLSKLTRKHVKVALTGDGGDELFHGYGAYNWAQRLSNPLWSIGGPILHKMFEYSSNNRLRRVSHMLNFKHEPSLRSHIFSQEQYFFSQSEIVNSLLRSKENFYPLIYKDAVPKGIVLNDAEMQGIFDIKYYLKDDLLVKVDMSSMHYGLECRSPFLDTAVIEFALKLHHTLKIKGNERKWILKQLLSKYLPPELIYRRKWGFSIPLSKWLKNDLRFLIDKYLNQNCVEEIGLFEFEFVSQLVNSFLKNQNMKYLFHRVWLLIVVQRWMKENSNRDFL